MGRMGRCSSTAGQAVISQALFMPVVLGMVGMAVGRLAQSAAMLEPIAGAQEVPYVAIVNDFTASALAASASNHYTNGTGSVTVAQTTRPHSVSTQATRTILRFNDLSVRNTAGLEVVGVDLWRLGVFDLPEPQNIRGNPTLESSKS
jgi:hypothetical protein